MKKLIALTLGVMLLAGCASTASTTAVKTGLGHSISIAKSKDAPAADKNGAAQVDTVMAAASFDAKGTILSVTIDTAQTKVDFDAQGKIKSDKAAKGATKVELGDKYGMKAASEIKKEWFEQIAELEKWMVGKTVDQVKAMKVKKVDAKTLTDEADLKSKVTVGIEDYLFAIEEAYKNAK